MAHQFPRLPLNLTYYQLLGVDVDADDAEIRAAFRGMAKKLHPDLNKDPAAAELLKVVTQVYSILIDREQRAKYDALMRPPAPAPSQVGPTIIIDMDHSVFWPDIRANATGTGTGTFNSSTTGAYARMWRPNQGWYGFF